MQPGGQGAACLLGSRQHVDAATAWLASLIAPAFLAEAVWDPRTRMLSLPHEHPLLRSRRVRSWSLSWARSGAVGMGASPGARAGATMATGPLS